MFNNIRLDITWRLGGHEQPTRTIVYSRIGPEMCIDAVLDNLAQTHIKDQFKISGDREFNMFDCKKEYLYPPNTIVIDTEKHGLQYKFPEDVLQACVSKVFANDFADLEVSIYFDKSEYRQPLMPDANTSHRSINPIVVIDPPIYLNNCPEIDIRIDPYNGPDQKVKLEITYQKAVPIDQISPMDMVLF